MLHNAPSIHWLADLAAQIDGQVVQTHPSYGTIYINNSFGKGDVLAGITNVVAISMTEGPIMYVRWNMQLHQNTQIKSIPDPADAFFRIVFFVSNKEVFNKTETVSEELLSGIKFTTTGAPYDLYIPANTFGTSFTITFAKQWLREHLAVGQEPILEKILNSTHPIELREIMPLPMRKIFDRISTNQFETFVDKMAFQESLTGLIRSAFEQLLADFKIKKSDYEAIVRAELLLIGNINEAPSIAFLASESAMSTTKFKLTFKKIYGKSVYNYYLHYRMEIARRWLNENQMNVAEVGDRLGYKNLSHFARIFKKHFGVYPSKYEEN
jgi:AraC-like DNA-binding protein